MLILEFGSETVKLLKVSRKGQNATLANFSKRAVGGLSDEAVSGVVLDLINQVRAGKNERLIISMPRYLATVRNLRLPSVDDVELKSMVDLQAGKQLPYPASELIWDFKVIERRADGYSDILLIIAHRNVIDRFVNILKGSKLELGTIKLSSEALYSWYLAVVGSESEEGPVSQIKAVVDIDAAYVDVVILRGNELEFSRSFPFKPDMGEMAEEIRKTFYSYQKENLREVSSVSLTGIEERALQLKPALEGLYQGKRIEFIHPLRIASDDYRASLPDYLDISRDASLACALGIVYNPGSIKMDFSPPDFKEANLKRKRKKAFVKTGGLLAALVLVLSVIFINRFMYIRSQLSLVELKMKETEPRVKQLKEISQNLEIIKQNLNVKGSAADVMQEIFRIAPNDVSIAVLDFELEKTLTLRGVSNNLNSVFKFASELEKSPYFEKCQIKYAQKRIVKAQELVDFELNCKMSRLTQ